MKKIIVLGLVVLLVIGSAIAVYGKAQKVDLFDDTSGARVGWVIANKNGAGEIIVQIHVQKGQADTPFYVFIKNDNWIYAGDPSRDGEFMTNNQGNGNFHGAISSEGVTYVQVVVREPLSVPSPRARYLTSTLNF